DGIFVLNFLFLGGTEPSCMDSADPDDSGRVDITDGIYLLNFLFLGGQPPLPPSGLAPNDCGVDPTDDDGLGCVSYPACPEIPQGLSAPTIGEHLESTTDDSVLIEGTTDDRTETIEANGPAGVVTVVPEEGRYAINVPLEANKTNTIWITAIAGDERSASVATTVTNDSVAPELTIQVPASGSVVFTDTIVVTGTVRDALSGFRGLAVSVDGLAANVNIGIGTNGTYERGGVPLEMGENSIVVEAQDELGNSRIASVTVYREEPPAGVPQLSLSSGNLQEARVHEFLPQPLTVELLDADGDPLAGEDVIFRVTRSDGELAAEVDGAAARRLSVTTAANGTASAFLRLGTDAGCGNNRVEVSAPGAPTPVIFCASALAAPPDQINVGSGNNQRSEAGAQAPEPLRIWVSDSCNGVAGVDVMFSVVQGGGNFGGEDNIVVQTTATGHAEVSFELGPDGGNNVVEANFIGNRAGPARFVLFGVVRDELVPTTLSGFVFDNGDQPIEGATCFVRRAGKQVEFTRSDADGRFVFDEDLGEGGPATLFVDGSTATRVGGEGGEEIPPGSFPSLSFEILLVQNAANTMSTRVLLPRLNANRVSYDGTADVELTVPGIEGLRMFVAKGTKVTLAGGAQVIDGTNDNSVDLVLSQVHHTDVPMPMPDGASPAFAWTLQPSGASFDPPIRVIYPNMTGLAPGSVSYFLNFNHDSGRFDIVASGQVTEDGSCIESDPGTGISVAGWGCNCPPYAVAGDCENDPCEEAKRTMNDLCNSSRGSSAGALRCQLACLANNACNPNQPEWVRNTITNFADRRRMGDSGPLEPICGVIPSWFPAPLAGPLSGLFTTGDACFSVDGTAHLITELIPSWWRDCDKIDDDEHNDFLNDILVPCLLDNSDLSPLYRLIGSKLVPIFAGGTREVIQALCPKNLGAGAAGLDFPDVPSQEDLDISDLLGDAALEVTAGPFFVNPGDDIQLTVRRKSDDADLTADADTNYFAAFYRAADDPMATVTAGGLVSVLSTPSPFRATPGMLLVYVNHGDDFGVKQFAVVGVDTDGDLIVDAFEDYRGLDPNKADDFASDTDGDGLSLLDELILGTHPQVADTDDDGVSDGQEIAIGSDPLNPNSNQPSLALPSGPILAVAGLGGGGGLPGVDDAAPIVTAGGQSVDVNDDGSFVISNISAPDQFGVGGPGSIPDFESDDNFVVRGTFVRGGVTYYVYSDCFKIRQGETFQVGDLTISDTPPLTIQELFATAEPPILTSAGQTSQIRLTATLSDGTTRDVTDEIECVTYRSSNARVVTVDNDDNPDEGRRAGQIRAVSSGQAFITAGVEGVAAVVRVIVSFGSPLTEVIGSVKTEDGRAVGGASVSVLGQPLLTQSGIDGSFYFPSVLADQGDLTVIATLRENMELLVGSASGLLPLRDGVTSTGAITLAPVRNVDRDGDGVADSIEPLLGFDPENPDTDGDGI
ncbi:MAG: hypothetical protein AAF488_10600, partial [Planctomycetota bacterium]